jgi:hypothetical protein
MALIPAVPVVNPKLTATLSGNSITLSWPFALSNYMVQATSNISDSHSWTTLSDVPVVVNQQNTLVKPITPGQWYFRLKK